MSTPETADIPQPASQSSAITCMSPSNFPEETDVCHVDEYVNLYEDSHNSGNISPSGCRNLNKPRVNKKRQLFSVYLYFYRHTIFGHVNSKTIITTKEIVILQIKQHIK